MKIFLDFDDVLFDTGRFRVGLRDVFARHGISHDVFSDTYKEIKERQRGIQTYDYDAHLVAIAQRVRFDEAALRKEVQVFVSDCGRYLFPDVESFMHAFKEQGVGLHVVSYGTSDFQKWKVQGSGIGREMDGIVAGDVHKGVVIREILEKDPADTVWFLDDRAYYIDHVEAENPDVHTILVTRPEGRYADEKTDKCDYQVRDLGEAKNIILGL